MSESVPGHGEIVSILYTLHLRAAALRKIVELIRLVLINFRWKVQLLSQSL
jgi:hypothetical protein